MNSFRLSSVAAGTLFVLGTVAALMGSLIDPLLLGPSFLGAVASNHNQVVICIIFYIVAAFSSASIPIVLYPITRQKHPALALSSVIFRSIEAVFYLVAVLSLLSLIVVSQKALALPAEQQKPLYIVGDTLLGLREQASLIGVISFCMGALMYYTIFFLRRLVPAWLSVWGIVALLAMLVACGLAMFSGYPITGYVFLILPIAVQEIVLAVWLLIRGFKEDL